MILPQVRERLRSTEISPDCDARHRMFAASTVIRWALRDHPTPMGRTKEPLTAV